MRQLTHEERRKLIYAPFFITYIGSSYPWGGTAVTDTFYGTHGRAVGTARHDMFRAIELESAIDVDAVDYAEPKIRGRGRPRKVDADLPEAA